MTTKKEMTMNTVSLESLAAALAYAMGIEPPIHAAPANPDLTAYIDTALAGKKADRIFIYNTDAIGQWLIDKYPALYEEVTESMDLKLPMQTVNPPKTPIAFGTMYTGAAPQVHGIIQYEKKLITIDTLFDAMARAGKKVALLSCHDYSMTIIFQERAIDYFIFDTWAEVNAKAAELIIRDEYDFILTYNANYDDIHHLKGPESPEAFGEIRFNCRTFCMFDALIRTHWSKHNVLIGTGMDHGCHELANGLGDHSEDTPQDRNIIHHYKAYPAKPEICL